MGRSYLHVPQDLDVDLRSEEPPAKCYVPKKLVHTWTGHTRGIAAIRLFPRSGHLLLSAGMDSKIKVRVFQCVVLCMQWVVPYTLCMQWVVPYTLCIQI